MKGGSVPKGFYDIDDRLVRHHLLSNLAPQIELLLLRGKMTEYQHMNSLFIIVLGEKIADGILTVLQNAAVTITIYPSGPHDSRLMSWELVNTCTQSGSRPQQCS